MGIAFIGVANQPVKRSIHLIHNDEKKNKASGNPVPFCVYFKLSLLDNKTYGISVNYELERRRLSPR